MARILILEDQIDLSNAWQKALTADGHIVRLATTYDEFEAEFRSASVELLIVDLSIDDEQGNSSFSGLVALSDNLLRTTLRGQRVPCIVVSGHFTQAEADDPLRKRVLPFHPEKILAKPFDIETLLSNVRELLRD